MVAAKMLNQKCGQLLRLSTSLIDRLRESSLVWYLEETIDSVVGLNTWVRYSDLKDFLR